MQNPSPVNRSMVKTTSSVSKSRRIVSGAVFVGAGETRYSKRLGTTLLGVGKDVLKASPQEASPQVVMQTPKFQAWYSLSPLCVWVNSSLKLGSVSLNSLSRLASFGDLSTKCFPNKSSPITRPRDSISDRILSAVFWKFATLTTLEICSSAKNSSSGFNIRISMPWLFCWNDSSLYSFHWVRTLLVHLSLTSGDLSWDIVAKEIVTEGLTKTGRQESSAKSLQI